MICALPVQPHTLFLFFIDLMKLLLCVLRNCCVFAVPYASQVEGTDCVWFPIVSVQCAAAVPFLRRLHFLFRLLAVQRRRNCCAGWQI